MKLGIEQRLVEILGGVRNRSNATFKRFHLVNPELGIYIDHNEVISFGSPSMRRLQGMKNIAIDNNLGNTDPVRNIFGHAQKFSGSLEHAVLKTTRGVVHGGIHASRSAAVDLLTGYGAIARIELTNTERFQLGQSQRYLPKIPVVSAALQIIGRSMARLDLVLPTDREDNILATDRNGRTLKTGITDVLLAGIGGLLLSSSEESE